MSTSNAPFGLKPLKYWSGGGGSQALQYNAAGINSGYTSSIYENSPVKYATAGTLNIGGATGAILGSFVGVKYTPLGDRPRITNIWPASQALATSTTAQAFFYDDPSLCYEIQADGSLAQSSIGDEGNFTTAAVGSGDSITGLSLATLNSTLAAAGTQAQMRIVGLALDADNDWGDTYTKVQVIVANHQYVSPQTAL